MTEEHTQEWHDGYAAYENGAHWADNPYTVNAPADLWLEWDKGWSQAQDEDAEAIETAV